MHIYVYHTLFGLLMVLNHFSDSCLNDALDPLCFSHFCFLLHVAGHRHAANQAISMSVHEHGAEYDKICFLEGVKLQNQCVQG